MTGKNAGDRSWEIRRKGKEEGNRGGGSKERKTLTLILPLLFLNLDARWSAKDSYL